MSDILIFGGHGKVAMLATPLLRDAGHTVTSVIRNADQSDEIRAAGGEPLVLDVQHASQAELAEAIRGHDAVVWSAGAGGGSPERTYAVDRDAAIRSMDAAMDADVRRYLMVSYMGASLDHDVPEDNPFYAYAQSKAEADEHLRTSQLNWTILGPGVLSETTASERITVDPEGTGEEAASTARANVAHAIVAALADDSNIGRQVEFADGDTPIREVFSADA